MNMNGKVALITGASVGIGRATALAMAEYGAKLILLDVDLPRLEKVRDEVQAYTQDVLIYHCDISNLARVNEVVAEAAKAFGKIDILVNNAALWRSRTDFLSTPIEEWKKYFDINIMGTVYVTKAVLPLMVEQHYGRIINVASVAGVYGNRRMAHYSATKGALISFTHALAKEVAEHGVLVNAVSPGTVSPSSEEDPTSTHPSEMSYLGRTGSGRENAELICFLASDKASYITGQNIQIDGCRKKL